jgi:hypothetical protein
MQIDLHFFLKVDNYLITTVYSQNKAKRRRQRKVRKRKKHNNNVICKWLKAILGFGLIFVLQQNLITAKLEEKTLNLQDPALCFLVEK